jgi:hypothetical protein
MDPDTRSSACPAAKRHGPHSPRPSVRMGSPS